MKILQIAPAWIDSPPEGYGGTEWVIYNIVNGLHQLHHQVTLFATKNSQSADKLAYTFERSFLDMDLPWEAALPALMHYHQAYKLADQFDIVHAHLSSQTDMVNLPFLADLAEQNIPAVLTIHGHPPYDRFSYIDDDFFKQYASKITVINISQAMEQVTNPLSFQNGGVVHNSMDPAAIKFNPKGGKYLTWLGKIIPEKGTHQAILAAKQANEQFVFAGIVDQLQPKSVKYFEEQIQPHIDDKQIKFLGPADNKLKNTLLGEAKGFLNPIDWIEPFGMVMVESMAAGTPVISYTRGAAPEIIKHEVTGYLVKSLDEMVDAIKLLPSINRQDCRDHIETAFSPVTAAQKHLEIYQKLISATKNNKVKNKRTYINKYKPIKILRPLVS